MRTIFEQMPDKLVKHIAKELGLNVYNCSMMDIARRYKRRTGANVGSFSKKNVRYAIKKIYDKYGLNSDSWRKIDKQSYDFSSKKFLSSYEWRSLRMKVIKYYGSKCQCCGSTPENGSVMNVDHIKPRKKYPDLALNFDNLQVLCDECNHGKGNWDETDWRK